MLTIEQLAAILEDGFEQGENAEEREDNEHIGVLRAIAAYISFEPHQTGPEFEADDLRRHILELGMIADAIHYAQARFSVMLIPLDGEGEPETKE